MANKIAKRRKMRFGVLFFVMALLLSSEAVADHTQQVIDKYCKECTSKKIAKAMPPDHGLAVSLSGLQKEMMRSALRATRNKEIFDFYGLKHLIGYVEDTKRNDIVLFGIPGNPSLKLDDFVIAIRNAWYVYAEKKGHVIQYAAPACSLDPDAGTFEALQRLSGMYSDPDTLLPKWKSVCQRPQMVKLFGMPESSFGAACITADYRMKLWVNGSMKSEGIKGSADLAIESVKKQLDDGLTSISVPAGGISRYWFHAGDVRYQRDNGVTWLSRLPVVLLTEQQFLSWNREIQGGGRPNRIAEAIAYCFSQKFDTIRKGYPEFEHLYQLYRHVAIARLLKTKHDENRMPMSLKALLEAYPLANVAVPETLPGISGFKSFKHHQGRTTHYLAMPSCGGASFDMKPKQEATAGDLLDIQMAILTARPDDGRVSWAWVIKRVVK